MREVQQFSQLPQGLTGFDSVFFAYEECRDYKISQYIEEIKSNRNRTVQKIAVIIGSEGGFSPAEAELLIQCGISSDIPRKNDTESATGTSHSGDSYPVWI